MARRIIAVIEQDGRIAKVYRDTDWNEYRVRFSWLTPAADYFTSERDDAIGTARAVLGPPQQTAS
jgi:hypothetical protein